jgi:hypothetical protein
LILVLFCFVFCNKWLDHNKFLLEEIYFVFHCQEHSSFHSYRSMSVLFFSFVFHLDFYSDPVLSFNQGVFRPLVYVGFHQKSCFKKFWMVLEKRKSFMQKKWYKKELV